MLLIVYIFICIMHASSNLALQNDYFEGKSSLTDVPRSELRLVREPNRQRRFGSGSKSNRMFWKFPPDIDKGNGIISSKILRSLRYKADSPEDFGTNRINSRFKNRKLKDARQNFKTRSRAISDDAENIMNLFNKSGPPLEYVKKTFQISVDSKEDSPELSRTKNFEKWRKKNLPHKTRMKNKDYPFKKSSLNFPKRHEENKNRSMQKSKKRSIGLPFAYPIEAKFFRPGSECQPLENFQLFQNAKFSKLFNPDLYKKCLLLRKTNKVELLIKNEGDATKFLEDALHGDLYSVFKVMDRLPITGSYESVVPEEYKKLLDNIQPSFKSLGNSNLLNTESKEDNFLPIEPNKFPVSESLAEEVQSSSDDPNIADIYMFPNYIGDENSFDINGLNKGKEMYENIPVYQMQNHHGNIPPVNQVSSPTVQEPQNYIFAKNKEIPSKIILPNEDTTSKESFAAKINHISPTPVSQMKNLLTITPLTQLKIFKKPTLGKIINIIPTKAPFVRTEFPYLIKKEQVPTELLRNLYSPTSVTSTKTGPLNIGEKVQQFKKPFSDVTTFRVTPIKIQTSSVKSEPLETTTKITEIVKVINQTESPVLFTVNTEDIHIIITEPFVTEAILEAIAPIVIRENTETDYNVRNPPVDIVPKEEMPETDIKMRKMHFRHSHASREPEIRYRRQGFHRQ